jgi:hypothetical protein
MKLKEYERWKEVVDHNIPLGKAYTTKSFAPVSRVSRNRDSDRTDGVLHRHR